jgi:hypothetical protein
MATTISRFSRRKVLHHPTRGLLRLGYVTFRSNGDPTLRVAIHTPALA